MWRRIFAASSLGLNGSQSGAERNFLEDGVNIESWESWEKDGGRGSARTEGNRMSLGDADGSIDSGVGELDHDGRRRETRE